MLKWWSLRLPSLRKHDSNRPQQKTEHIIPNEMMNVSAAAVISPAWNEERPPL